MLGGGLRGLAGATSSSTLSSAEASTMGASSLPNVITSALGFAAAALGLAAAAAYFFLAAAAFLADSSYLVFSYASFVVSILAFFAPINGSTNDYTLSGTRASNTPNTTRA